MPSSARITPVSTYPDYAFNQQLFTSEMKVYSDSKISDFINSFTRDQSIAFQNEWNVKRDHREKIYISYDSTNKNCQAGDIDFVEYGHAKEDASKPILNYSIAFDRKNSEQLFYENYPGSIVDVSQIQMMLAKAKGYGYRQAAFILDRGYFSKGKIHYMDKCDYDFIIMMKGMKSLVSELILEVKGTFEDKREHSIRDYKVSGTTVKRKLYPSDEKTATSIYFMMTAGRSRSARVWKTRLTAWLPIYRNMKARSRILTAGFENTLTSFTTTRVKRMRSSCMP